MATLTELSLFSGFGGFSLGLRLAGIQTRTVAYVEWERYPQEILKARIKDGYLDDAPIFSDISAFRGEQFRGLVDLLTAGFPCQPHSTAGQRRGKQDKRNLWPETLRVIREVRPKYVLMENVPGILSASTDGARPAYGGTVVGELAQIGYSVHWQTLGADDVGAPHRRKRWWCIAELADTDSYPVWDGQQLCGQREAASSAPARAGHAGEELADSDGLGSSSYTRNYGKECSISEEKRKPEYSAALSGRSSAELDDPQHDGQPSPQEPGGVGSRVHPQGRAEQPEQPERSGVSAAGREALADSDKRSRIQRKLAEGSGYPIRQRGELGDSDSTGLQGRQQPLRGSAYELPAWPPSPSDTDGWARVYAERPDLAPAITKEAESQFRGVVDGRSHRVDQLKALGNGIVPAVAAEFLKVAKDSMALTEHEVG